MYASFNDSRPGCKDCVVVVVVVVVVVIFRVVAF
jgi:hypothetical protein